MSIEEIVESIPTSSWEAVSERFIDVILNSPKANKMPSGLARTILYYWQRDQLATKIGIQRLLEAAMAIDPEVTYTILGELGLQEVATVLKNL